MWLYGAYMSISETAIEFRLFRLDTLDIPIAINVPRTTKTVINTAIKQPLTFFGCFGSSTSFVLDCSGTSLIVHT